MFICMCGFPYSGKSEFVSIFTTMSHNTITVDPSLLWDRKLNSEIENQLRIKTWEIALADTKNKLRTFGNDSIIILDTTGSNVHAMRDVLMQAKMHKHDSYIVYVDANLQTCRQRVGNNIWIDNRVETKYKDAFIQTLPMLAKLGKLIIVPNDHTIESLHEQAKKVVEIINAKTNRVH